MRVQDLTERYGRTRDVPYGDHGGHGGRGGHGRRGAGRDTRWVTSPITELTAQITAVTASDTAVEQCTTEKRNYFLGPEPTTEPVTSCLGATVNVRIPSGIQNLHLYFNLIG